MATGLFNWTATGGIDNDPARVIAPDERLPWPQTAAMGAQHVIAMFGATVLAPILMGFDPNIAVLMGGVGKLLFYIVTGGRVPSYLGSSFAFIGAKIWVDNRVDFSDNRNLIVAAITLILGTGDFTLRIGSFAMNGIGTATFGALLLWLLLGRGRPAGAAAAPRR